MAVYSFLVVAFYVFLGLFLGNRTAEITVTTLFSFAVRLEVRHRISGCFFTLKLSSYLFFSQTFSSGPLCYVSVYKVYGHRPN